MRNRYKKLLTVAFCIILAGCEDFLKTEVPTTQLDSSLVFSTDGTATSVTLGMYEKIMENYNSIFNGQLTLCAGLSADELLNTTGNTQQEEFYGNAITTSNDQIKSFFWNPTYSYIYQANSVIEGLSKTNGVTPTLAAQLEGEARVIRAFSHFYLMNLFGEVPYVTTTDYRLNSSTVKSPVSKIFDGVVDDLIKAQGLLGDAYVSSGRVRPNKAVATALLARVYLYKQDWVNAEIQASKLISDPQFSLLTDLTKVFLANSGESIWQMIPVSAGINTAEGNRFAQTSGTPTVAEISPQLIPAFQSGDKRLTNWISQYTVSGHLYYMPYKYKVRTAAVLTEYYTVLRLAEQYLIRAEARAKQNNLSGAIADVDAIRGRAGLPLIQVTNPSITQANLLLAIEQERRVELFCEWGHRWLDLKRTGRADAVMQIQKPGKWKPQAALYPIPLNETLINANLTQNPGY